MELGQGHVVRPILYPPDGPIGGHCVVPNAKILSEEYESEFLRFIIECGGSK
jgi:hypothetical protein